MHNFPGFGSRGYPFSLFGSNLFEEALLGEIVISFRLSALSIRDGRVEEHVYCDRKLSWNEKSIFERKHEVIIDLRQT